MVVRAHVAAKAAIANPIGQRLTELPMSPPKVLAALDAGRGGGSDGGVRFQSSFSPIYFTSSRLTAMSARMAFSSLASSRLSPKPGPSGNDKLPVEIAIRLVVTVSTTLSGPTHSSPVTRLKKGAA